MSQLLVFLVAAFVPALVFGGIIDNRLEDCSGREDPTGCLAATAAAALGRAARMSDIQLFPGVTLVQEAASDAGREGRQLQTQEELEASLPQEPSQRTQRVLDMLYESGLGFLKSHSLKLQVPEDAPESLQRALEEGRAKIKKKLLPILMLVGVKLAALLPLAIGAIGIVALKALLVGKLAFIIAAVIAFQKFFSGSGGSGGIGSFGKSPVVDYGPSSGSSGWSSGASASSGGPYYRRSMDSTYTAQDLAYSAHIPSVDTNAAQ